jgi:hypothetical protein
MLLNGPPFGTVTNGGPLSEKILEISLEIRSEAP